MDFINNVLRLELYTNKPQISKREPSIHCDGLESVEAPAIVVKDSVHQLDHYKPWHDKSRGDSLNGARFLFS